jgi:hypothetical protein
MMARAVPSGSLGSLAACLARIARAPDANLSSRVGARSIAGTEILILRSDANHRVSKDPIEGQ